MSEQQTGAEVRVECAVRGALGEWLAQASGSIALTTYQAGKVALIGWDGRQVTLLMRDFPKPLGMAVEGSRMALVTRHELCLLADAPALAPEYLVDQPGRYDSLYLPRASYYTGDLHIHDIAYGEDGGLWLVNTRFSCLARLSERWSFEPVWRPTFVSDLVPEDRCHLNGLALADGKPAYVTALGTTDYAGGWREDKATGGVLIDVASGEVIYRGLSMPHSPRLYGGRLWVLNSGRGELLAIDRATGKADVACRLPGYLRGLCFVGPYALVGMSHIREKHIFGGLPIQELDEPLRCGVTVVDLRSGSQVGSLEFTGGCTELYDVQFLAGRQRPMIVAPGQPVWQTALSNPESSFWLRPDKELPPVERPGGGGTTSPPGPLSMARA